MDRQPRNIKPPAKPLAGGIIINLTDCKPDEYIMTLELHMIHLDITHI